MGKRHGQERTKGSENWNVEVPRVGEWQKGGIAERGTKSKSWPSEAVASTEAGSSSLRETEFDFRRAKVKRSAIFARQLSRL